MTGLERNADIVHMATYAPPVSYTHLISDTCHFGYLLHNYRVVYCILCVFSPGERTVVFDQYSRCMYCLLYTSLGTLLKFVVCGYFCYQFILGFIK